MWGNIGSGINQGLGMYAGMGKKFPWEAGGLTNPNRIMDVGDYGGSI
jgi:hypothetical protein